MLALAPLLATAAAWGHPLGNDTITHFSILYICPDRVEIDFHLDFAELPATAMRKAEIDADRNDEDTVEEQMAWLNRKAEAFAADLRLALDGQPLPIRPVDVDPPASAPADTRPAVPKRAILKITGVAGMPTYRTVVRYAAPLPVLDPSRRYTLTYLDATYPRERGLMRVLLERSDAVIVHETACQYLDEPPDPFLYELYDPAWMPQEREGRVVFSLAAAAATGERGGAWDRFTDPRNDPSRTDTYRRQAERIEKLFTGGTSGPVLALIGLLCFAYGAWHALMPGHAKTIVAAYLISLRGTYWHALLLAIIVTLTHTSLVIVVGLVFLKVTPEAGSRLQLWLGLAAGALIAAMGLWLLFRAWTGRLRPDHGRAGGHDHDGHHHHHHNHGHGHAHDHAHDHEHPHPPVGHHDHAHEHAAPANARGWLRALLTHSHPHIPSAPPGSGPASGAPRLTVPLLLWLGISGGIVPCPAAVLIMLAGIAQGKPAVGLFAVVVFGLGLALTLMTIGLLALSSRRFAERCLGEEGSRRWLLGVLPALGGLAVAALGTLIAWNYVLYLTGRPPLIAWLG